MKVESNAVKVDNSETVLQKLLHSFEKYYDVKVSGVVPPFSAEAEFHSHSEQYFFIKAAHVANIDSHEYVFFAETDALDEALFEQLAVLAWEEGISRVEPYYGHRNSDITLIILTPEITEGAANHIRKSKKSKTYKFSFYGWTNFRALAYETSTGRAVTNRHGNDLKKLVGRL